METAINGRSVPVAGFVRGKKTTQDGNFKFRVVNQWFLLPKGSLFAQVVKQAERALVIFEQSDKKYPRVLSVVPNYTGIQVRDATCT